MNLRDLFQELNVSVAPEGHHHVTSGWIGVDCPFCSPGSGKYRMGIPIDRPKVSSCWTCGTHPIIETVSILTGEAWSKCKELLGNLDVGNYIPEERPVGRLRLPGNLGPLQDSHKMYLRDRGYDVDLLVSLYSLQGLGLDGQRTSGSPLRWRVFIPIQRHGKMVSWTTRSIVNNVKSRYLSADPTEEAVSHKTLLYAEDYVRHAIVVTEGPLDAWKIGPGAVCTFGTAFTKQQVLKISKYPVRVICFDKEREAQKGADRLCNLLKDFPGETYRVELKSKDPGEAGKQEIRELRKRFLD